MTDLATDTAPANVDTAPDSTTSTQAIETQDKVTNVQAEVTETLPIEVTESNVTEFSLPEEHMEKSWASKVKSQDDLYKQIDNLTEMVGKKTIKPIDYSTASQEEIDAYHASIAPEDVSSYKWGDHSMEEITGPMSETFQKLGINAYQQEKIAEQFDAVIEQIASEKHEADTSKDGYIEIMKESFGETYERDMGIVEKALKEFVSKDEDKQFLDSVDNKTRAVVDRTVLSIIKSYEEKVAKILSDHGAVETGSQADGGEGFNSGVNIEEKKSQLRKRIHELDGKPFAHSELASLKKQLSELYK